MTMQTIDTNQWHARFRALEALADAEPFDGSPTPATDTQEAIEQAFDGVTKAFAANGLKWANTDEAEMVVAAITRFLFKSNPAALAHTALLIDAKVGA